MGMPFVLTILICSAVHVDVKAPQAACFERCKPDASHMKR